MLQAKDCNGTSQSEKSKKFSFSGTLNSLGKIDRLPEFRFRWNSNEEVFTILTSLEEHKNWAASEVKMRPPNGSQLLYNRNNLKTHSYHNDKYIWKTRKNSKSSARVDHSSLRIRGIECIYCSYVHSALVPTFHRRCYWLLENPDIVFVHYLNIPDKTTTFDDLLTSLLPFKKLTEQELCCQLQPILTSSQDERNNNTTLSVDVDKLVKDVKNYKEPKTKGRGNQKRTSGSDRQVASSSSGKPQESNAKSSHVLDKCSNCNRLYTPNCSSTSSSSRTNVAVTINRLAGTSSRTKAPVSDGIGFAQVSFDTEPTAPNTAGQALMSSNSVVKSAIKQNILTSNSIPHDFSNHSLLTDLTREGNADHYPCHDFVASHTSNETSSNSCHGYANLPVTSEASPCVLDNNLVVLDYDGINLFQSNQLENDLSNDISFKELVQYLEQPVSSYPSDVHDLQYDTPALFIEGAPELTKTSSSMNLGEAAPCNTVMSNGIHFPSYPQCGNLVQQTNVISSTIGTTIGLKSCSPTDMISTDCHTFNNLISSVMHPDASNFSGAIDNPVLNSHHCSANDQKLTFEKGTQMNMFQMGVPKGSLSDEAARQREGFLQDGNQVNVSQFGGLPANMAEMATSNVVVANLAHPVDTQVGSYQQDGYRVEMSEPGCSKEDASGVDTTPEGLPNAGGSTRGNPQMSSLSTQGNPDVRITGNPPGDIITEFSPEWSYCDGKTKVLILGNWSHHNGNYSCLFDGCSVPATLIPPGVLRCFCPPHEPGLVALQVAWNGFIVSNACVFEYKTRDSATNCVSDWLDTSDSDLEKLILQRIERLEGILGINVSSGDTEVDVGVFEDELGAVEDRIVRICEVLLGQPGTCMLPDTETGPKGLTLLHLAAGLGYTKLIRLLQDHGHVTQTAVTSKHSAEWSPRSKDSFGCTPLMWASWRGHNDAAMTLLAWEPSLYSDCDHSGRSAKEIAQEMGHLDLVHEMEEFIRSEDMFSLVMENSPQSPSSSCAYLSVSSCEQIPQSPMSADSLTWERVEGVSEPSGNFEMASVISEERPNTLGKVLVEVRTLIEEAEERAMSPLHTPSNSAPFSLGFTGFSDLNSDEGTSDNLIISDPDFVPRTSQYDTLSIDSSPIRTPSSHSPGSPALRNSPQSTGTDTSEFEEFLTKPRQFLERDFSELTLTDIEQQELLQAAKVIQNAYRQFKNRKKQHIDELKAAVLIQSYYRRYKQFALYKKITKAAVVIQNSYRAHKEHEQFKRSRHAAAVIQTYFRHYRKRKQRHAEEDAPGKRLEKKYRKPSYGK